MTDKEKLKLATKAIRDFAVEHWGWGAKYHPDQLDKFNACMEIADKLERGTANITAPTVAGNW